MWQLLLMTMIVFAVEKPREIEKMVVTEHLGAQFPVESIFRWEDGHQGPVRLVRPTIFVFAYYECPMLCTLVLNGLVQALEKMHLVLGKDYDVITLSIDAREMPELARQKKNNLLAKRRVDPAGWHFLTASEQIIRLTADTLGFPFSYDARHDQFIHPALIIVLTAQGRIARYLYGTEFVAQDLDFAIKEARQGTIAKETVLDRVLLFCFHFDPSKNHYILNVWRIVQIVISIQVIVMALFLIILWRPTWIKK